MNSTQYAELLSNLPPQHPLRLQWAQWCDARAQAARDRGALTMQGTAEMRGTATPIVVTDDKLTTGLRLAAASGGEIPAEKRWAMKHFFQTAPQVRWDRVQLEEALQQWGLNAEQRAGLLAGLTGDVLSVMARAQGLMTSVRLLDGSTMLLNSPEARATLANSGQQYYPFRR